MSSVSPISDEKFSRPPQPVEGPRRRPGVFWSHWRFGLQENFSSAPVDDPPWTFERADHRRRQGGLVSGAVPGAGPRKPPRARRWGQRRGLRETRQAAPLCRRQLQRRVDLRRAARAARRCQAPDSLPGHPAQLVWGGGRPPGDLGLRRQRAGHHREALRTRSRLGQGLESNAALDLRRVGCLSHRPLPRERSRPKPHHLAFRQHLSRADLESQLRRERPDHHG